MTLKQTTVTYEVELTAGEYNRFTRNTAKATRADHISALLPGSAEVMIIQHKTSAVVVLELPANSPHLELAKSVYQFIANTLALDTAGESGSITIFGTEYEVARPELFPDQLSGR